MKTTCHTLLVSLALATSVSADTIVQWNFNSVPPDSPQNQGTGTDVPSIGNGTISVVGTTLRGTDTALFTSGNGSTDPATTDDSAYHTRAYPLQGESNKTSGIEVRASTVGYESIVVTWDQQNSGTASKYLRFQYSLDGTTFVDYDVMRMDVVASFANSRTVNLSPILGANGNPNFAFRLVSEFENTATGNGIAGYVPGSGTYSTNGTMRFDMLTVSGSLPDGNAFPTISSISNQTIRANGNTGPLPFQVADAETPAEQLTVTGVSSNPTLVLDAAIIFDETLTGTNRAVSVFPAIDQTGTATITLFVTDGGGKSNRTSFVLTVLPGNTAPAISTITNVHTLTGTAFAPVSLTISDAEQSSDSLLVTAVSSDQALIPDANLSVTPDNGALNITPAPGQVGTAIITVTVEDNGFLTATRAFNAMVVPSSKVVLLEPFSYTDGPVTTNSANLWTTRAGIPGQMQVVFGTALVTFSQTEDVIVRLINGPYSPNTSTVLYASFDVTFSALPGVAPDVFAHFSGTDASNLRGRVLASTTNAAAGSFRLGVANGVTASTVANVVDYPLDLSLDTTYLVVVAYDVAAGTSKLWVNPASGGAWVNAIDTAQPATPINSYGLRQSGGIGDMRIDNLRVGLSFEAVTPNLARLRVARSGANVEVSWPSAGTWEGFFLESTRILSPPDWQVVNIPSVIVDDWDVVTITNATGNEIFRLKRF